MKFRFISILLLSLVVFSSSLQAHVIGIKPAKPYVQALPFKLKANRKYHFSFKYKNNSAYRNFFTDLIAGFSTQDQEQPEWQVQLRTPNYVVNKNLKYWIECEFSYIAKGGERFFFWGSPNFQDYLPIMESNYHRFFDLKPFNHLSDLSYKIEEIRLVQDNGNVPDLSVQKLENESVKKLVSVYLKKEAQDTLLRVEIAFNRARGGDTLQVLTKQIENLVTGNSPVPPEFSVTKAVAPEKSPLNLYFFYKAPTQQTSIPLTIRNEKEVKMRFGWERVSDTSSMVIIDDKVLTNKNLVPINQRPPFENSQLFRAEFGVKPMPKLTGSDKKMYVRTYYTKEYGLRQFLTKGLRLRYTEEQFQKMLMAEKYTFKNDLQDYEFTDLEEMFIKRPLQPGIQFKIDGDEVHFYYPEPTRPQQGRSRRRSRARQLRRGF